MPVVFSKPVLNLDTISLHKDFIADLRKSHNPFVVLFVGKRRSGKSTAANNFIRQMINHEEPFRVSLGRASSKEFRYAGPFDFHEIAALHGLTPDDYPPTDVFVIDCRGYDPVHAKDITLERSFAVLAPLVSLVVLVAGDEEPDTLLAESESWAGLTRPGTREDDKCGHLILIPGLGVDCSESADLDDQNALRLRQDNEICESVQRAGRDRRNPFQVLVLPKLEQRDLFQRAHHDLVVFMSTIANRPSLDAKILIGAVELISGRIMNIEDLASPEFAKLQFCVRLYTWQQHALGWAKRAIEDELSRGHDVEQTSAAFAHGDLVRGIIEGVLAEFDGRLPGDSDDSRRVEVGTYRNPIEAEMQESAVQLWIHEYLDNRVPNYLQKLKDDLLAGIGDELSALTITVRGDFPYGSRLTQADETFKRLWDTMAHGIDGIPAEITNSNAYRDQVRAAESAVRGGLSRRVLEVVECAEDRKQEKVGRQAAEQRAADAERERADADRKADALAREIAQLREGGQEPPPVEDAQHGRCNVF
jgi:hypothetical protein